MNRWLAAFVWSILIGIWFGECPARVAAVPRPVIVVKVDATGLPAHFLDRRMAVESASKSIQSFAIKKLNEMFPLFDWRPVLENGNAQATVVLFMKDEGSAGGRVSLSARYQLNGAAEEDLPVAPQDVYSDGATYPSLRQIEGDLTTKGKNAVNRFLDASQLNQWREFIGVVPLARVVIPRNRPSKLLVVPVNAREIRANRKSVIQVDLVAEVNGEPPTNGMIEMHPDGISRTQEYAGSLECLVAKFTFAGEQFNMWVEGIVDVIKATKSLEVRVTHYVKGDLPTLSYE